MQNIKIQKYNQKTTQNGMDFSTFANLPTCVSDKLNYNIAEQESLSNKKSAQSANSSGVAHSTIVLNYHPTKNSITDEKNLSSILSVDKQKDVDGRGIAPLSSWVIIQSQHCAPPTSNLLYQNNPHQSKSII